MSESAAWSVLSQVPFDDTLFKKNNLSFDNSEFPPEFLLFFIATVGMVKIPLISWSSHKGLFLTRSLFKAP